MLNFVNHLSGLVLNVTKLDRNFMQLNSYIILEKNAEHREILKETAKIYKNTMNHYCNENKQEHIKTTKY